MGSKLSENTKLAACLENNSDLKYLMTCMVCLDEPCNTCLLPCAHLICYKCARLFDNCPLCRTLIRGTVKMYLPWSKSDIVQIITP